MSGGDTGNRARGLSPTSGAVATGAVAAAFAVLVGGARWFDTPVRAGPPRGGSQTTGTEPHGDPATGPRRAESVVYGRHRVTLRFSHQRHLQSGMQCEECHDQARSSRRVSDRLIPSPETCDRCHGDAHPATHVPFGSIDPARQAGTGARSEGVAIAAGHGARALSCVECHPATPPGSVPPRSEFVPAALTFSHALHMRDADMRCERCHTTMSGVRLATEAHLPSEASCLSCHDGRAATDRCAACHAQRPGGRVKTAVREGLGARLIPGPRSSWGIDHDIAFVRDHRGPAKAQPGLCRSCHDDAQCLDCHAGTLRPLRIHASDYLTMHGFEARGQEQACNACHRAQTDCRACHERLGLFGRDEGSAFTQGSGRSFHPADWVGPPGSPGQGHAFAAQSNLSSCASCHGEDTCLACHATAGGPTGGLGVSPHGANFSGSVRCAALASANRRVCLRCHAAYDPALECL